MKKRTKAGRDSKGRFKKGHYQPCSKGAAMRKAKGNRKASTKRRRGRGGQRSLF